LPAPIIPTITTVFFNRQLTGQRPAYAFIIALNGVIFADMPYKKKQPLQEAREEEKAGQMKYVVKGILVLVVLGLAALGGFAYLGDLSPIQTQVVQPVKINVD
jgi:hypothetical protein